MTKLPVPVSNQYAAFAMRPTGRIALRSLLDMPIAFDAGFRIFNSSPIVLTISRRAMPSAPGRGAEHIDGIVRDARDLLPDLTVIPFVSHDAADRGRGAAQNRRVTDRCDGRKMLVMSIGEHRSAIQHTGEPASVELRKRLR